MPESRRQQAAGRRRRRTSTGTELSREAYADAAVNLIENRGASVLSARTLAAAVGADASALYRHFTGADDAVRAVADRMIGLGLDRWTPGSDWLESLAGLARVLFAVYAQDFPRAGLAVASRATGLPNELRAVELTRVVAGGLVSTTSQGRSGSAPSPTSCSVRRCCIAPPSRCLRKFRTPTRPPGRPCRPGCLTTNIPTPRPRRHSSASTWCSPRSNWFSN